MIAARRALVRQAFRLEYLTLAWMVVEAAVAIGSGIAAHSITLLAFGVDSLIELVSAVVLIWRLTAARSLWTGQGQDFSWPGVLVAFAAIPVMWVLSRRKLRIAAALGSRALRADAVESLTCGWLSIAVVIGLVAQLVLGAWWIDSVTSLVIVWLLVKEAREAWSAEEDDD